VTETGLFRGVRTDSSRGFAEREGPRHDVRCRTIVRCCPARTDTDVILVGDENTTGSSAAHDLASHGDCPRSSIREWATTWAAGSRKSASPGVYLSTAPPPPGICHTQAKRRCAGMSTRWAWRPVIATEGRVLLGCSARGDGWEKVDYARSRPLRFGPGSITQPGAARRNSRPVESTWPGDHMTRHPGSKGAVRSTAQLAGARITATLNNRLSQPSLALDIA